MWLRALVLHFDEVRTRGERTIHRDREVDQLRRDIRLRFGDIGWEVARDIEDNRLLRHAGIVTPGYPLARSQVKHTLGRLARQRHHAACELHLVDEERQHHITTLRT